MLRFALKNLWVKRVKALLVLLSIVISASVALLAYNVSTQISEGIVNTAGYYDLIIGPAGSSTQLAMNTMFFTDTPLGTIPYAYVEELERSGRTNQVVPFSMGDSYNGARIIGTTAAFLDGKPLSGGAMFDDVYQCVIGSDVAERNRLKVGDKIVTSHGLAESGAAHAASPLTVTGILGRTHTAYDNAVFTSYRTVWAIHGSEEHDHAEDEEAHGEEAHDHAEEAQTPAQTAMPSHGAPSHARTENQTPDASAESGHDGETEAHEGEVCAILVRTKSFNDYYALQSAYGENASLLAINPATVLREVLNNVDVSARIVYLLCGVILIMNVFVIAMITILNMYDSRREIALMRLIGVRMRRIAAMYMIQNAIVGLLAVLLSLAAAHALLGAMQSFVASIGVVLRTARIYPLEWAILAVVFIISVLPTLICTIVQSGKDGLQN